MRAVTPRAELRALRCGIPRPPPAAPGRPARGPAGTEPSVTAPPGNIPGPGRASPPGAARALPPAAARPDQAALPAAPPPGPAHAPRRAAWPAPPPACPSGSPPRSSAKPTSRSRAAPRLPSLQRKRRETDEREGGGVCCLALRDARRLLLPQQRAGAGPPPPHAAVPQHGGPLLQVQPGTQPCPRPRGFTSSEMDASGVLLCARTHLYRYFARAVREGCNLPRLQQSL